MTDESEPKAKPRARRRTRPSLEAEELVPAQPEAEPEEAPAAVTAPDDLPAVPHPALVPARPGTPPPPAGPPGSFVAAPPATAPAPARSRSRSNAQLTIGLVLIAFGAIALLGQFGLLWWLDGRLIWPVILIGGGAFLLLRRGTAR